MDGYQVPTLEDALPIADIYVTATGCFNVITADQMSRMKHQAIVANIGHFDNEIDMAGLDQDAGRAPDQHQAAGRRVDLRRRHRRPRTIILVLSEGRLMNLGNATGHPSFVMSNSFTNQVLAQIELFTKPEEYPVGVYTLPKHLDEAVARLHLDALGVRLTELTAEPGRLPRRAAWRARTSPTTTATDCSLALGAERARPRRRRPHTATEKRVAVFVLRSAARAPAVSG